MDILSKSQRMEIQKYVEAKRSLIAEIVPLLSQLDQKGAETVRNYLERALSAAREAIQKNVRDFE